MIGQTLGHYRILEELGSGGMGTVYLAEDTKLGRRIALKVLPEETARDPERRARFEREARAVAALNHPNIVVIHSVEEDRGIPFLTMEHVTGRRLSTLIPADGMRLRDFFAAAIPLAEAVHGAHRQGVTHRDLKPDNVMITEEGRVKVLDFGLAKVFEASRHDQGMTMTVGDVATREGKILGTAAYMSPEQAEGKPIDARTDIFSLGVILYELLTGRRPFTGDSQMSTLTAVLRDTPPAVTELKPDLPRHLARVVSRCLAKEPDRRYQTALDVRNELEALRDEALSEGGSALGAGGLADRAGPSAAPGTPTPPPYPTPYPSGPPSTPTPYPSGAYAAPGGADPSAHPSSHPSGYGPPPRRGPSPLLLGVGGVAVLAIAVAVYFGLRGTAGDSGGARVAANQAAGKDAAADKSIVVLPFENLGPPEDAYFAAGITDEIMSRLASISGLTVLSRTTSVQYDKSGKTMRQIGEDLGVDYVLEGTVRWEKLADGTSRVRVVPQLIRAADDAPIWSDRYEEAMEEIFSIQSTISGKVVDALGVTLLEPARMALNTKLTDNVDAYHTYLKAIEYAEGVSLEEEDMRLGNTLLQRAVELDPGFLVAHAMLAKSHASFVHFGYEGAEEHLTMADAEVKRVEALAPDSPWASYARGWVAYWGRKDLDAAVREMERVREELPGSADVLEAIGFIRRRQGRYEEALTSLKQAAEKDPRNTRLIWGVAETYALLDRFDRAQSELDRVITLSPDANVAFRLKAGVFLAQGDFAAARECLGKAPPGGNQLEMVIGGFSVTFYRGDREAALAAAQEFPDLANNQFQVYSKPLEIGLVEALLGDPAKARGSFGEAAAILRAAVREKPSDSRLRAALALALAGLGDREGMRRESEAAFASYPATIDLWIRSNHEVQLGYSLMLIGDGAGAAAQWKKLIESPGEFMPSRTILKVSPVFDSLRDRADFRALYEGVS